MNEPMINTATVTFEDEAGHQYAGMASVEIEVVGVETLECGAYLEKVASNHK